MNYNGKGYIKIRASTASSAFPISGAVVQIRGSEEGSGGEEYSVVTGVDGTSVTIELSAPAFALSQSPNPAEQPYSTYEITATAEGYYPIRLSGVAVFPEVVSIIPLDFIPNAGIVRNVQVPLSSVYSVIQENEELE